MANGETHIMRRILLELTGFATLFRNNVGARRLDDGSYLRYGVGGPGGADIIGFRSVTITPAMVGRKVAVFAAIEVKDLMGRTTEQQDQFIKVVTEAGGLAGVARSVEEAHDILAI